MRWKEIKNTHIHIYMCLKFLPNKEQMTIGKTHWFLLLSANGFFL